MSGLALPRFLVRIPLFVIFKIFFLEVSLQLFNNTCKYTNFSIIIDKPVIML